MEVDYSSETVDIASQKRQVGQGMIEQHVTPHSKYIGSCLHSHAVVNVTVKRNH